MVLIALVFLTFCAVAVIVAVLATSDDDDGGGASSTPDPAGLAEYVQRLTDLGAEFDDRIVDLGTQLNEDLAAEDDEAARLVIVKQNFLDTAAANDDFVSGLEDVSPPEAIASSHDEMIAAGRAYADALDEAVDDLEPVDTFEDAQEIILDPALEELHSAFVDECAALVDAVEAQGGELAIFC